MAKKVATYCRVSMHNNAQQTLAQQQKRLQEYAEKNGYEICHMTNAIGSREMSNQMFLECLRDAKAKGADSILMVSTNRVAGTVDEMQKIRDVYEASGVTIETLAGSHLFPASKDMVVNFIMSVASEEDDCTLDDEETELVFGYDVTADGLVINLGEATVVKYVFNKIEEYTNNPPAVLVQEVAEEYAARGEEIRPAEAAGKVPYLRITNLIEEEIKEKWPEQYESMLYKQRHNRAIYERRDSIIEPIIDRDTWEKAQATMSHAQDEKEPQMGGMTMS